MAYRGTRLDSISYHFPFSLQENAFVKKRPRSQCQQPRPIRHKKPNLVGDYSVICAGRMPTDRIDILAVGHAPVLQINRRIYRALARLGWQVEIAIPRRLPWSSELNFVQPDHPEDPPIHRLEPRGRHLRFWSFEGLTDLLNRKRPRIVYLENGPDSLMAWVIGGWCRRNDALLIANTSENDILPIKEVLRGWRPKARLRSLRSHIWGRLARGRVSHVVAICKDGRYLMRSIGFGKAVTVTPLGFDPALFYPDASRRAAIRQALGLTEPSGRLLWSRNAIKRCAHTHCRARSPEGSAVAASSWMISSMIQLRMWVGLTAP